MTKNVPLEHPDFGKAFPCPTCQAAKLRQKQLDSLVENGGLSPHHMYTFEDFYALPDDLREGKELAAQACQTLAEEKVVYLNGIPKNGVLLWGVFSMGKTTLATAACIHFAARGGAILRVKWADFMDQVQAGYSPREGELNSDEILGRAQRAPFLMVDDIGDPKDVRPATPDKRRITHRLLEYRLENNLPTVATSNLSRDQMYWYFTDRTAIRIYELSHEIEVTGPGLRQL